MTDDRSPTERDVPDGLSQRAHRTVIGVLGLFLPVLLYVIAGLRPTTGLQAWILLNSVSAYYYTGAVGIFVGVLFSLALFLFTYRGYVGVWADRIVGMTGGAAAVMVALFPTGTPDGLTGPAWWNKATGRIHTVAAIVLFVTFILFSVWLFRKSNIPRRPDRPPPKRLRDDICLACGLVMIAAVLWAGIAALGDGPIFIPETVAMLGFAVSWLVKGEAHQIVRDAATRLMRKTAGD
jgi:heme/copper-type cytochrome/quinol oxidase subunit 2